MSVSLGQLDQGVLDLLKAESGDSNYSTAMRYSAINKAISDICSGFIDNPSTGERLQKGNLTFLESSKRFTIERSMGNTAIVGGVTINVGDTTGVTAGYATINNNVFAFTGVTPTTLTGTVGIDYAHPINSRISKLYTLPSDNLYVTNVILRKNGSSNPMTLDFISFDNWENRHSLQSGSMYDMGSVVQSRECYTIIQGKYLLVDSNSIGAILEVRYQKMPTALALTSDLTIIPDQYLSPTTTSCSGCVVELACEYILRARGEGQEALIYANLAFNSVYALYATEGNKTMQEQSSRIRTGSDSIFSVTG